MAREIRTVGAVGPGTMDAGVADTLLFGYLNHAVRMCEEGYASREDIDAAMTLGCGLPMGPLLLLDLIGLDTACEILGTIHARRGNRRYAPAPLLERLVAAGRLGRKSGHGFHRYAAAGSSTVVPDPPARSGTAAGSAVRPVQAVGVVGSGTMATGIAEVLARAGLDVVLVARGTDRVASVFAALGHSLDRAVARGKLTGGARTAALGRVRGTTSLAELATADLVVEAVVEDLAVKRDLFAALDDMCRPGAILATTTSSLPVIECAAATCRAPDVVGMHFFNPAPVMRLVEVVSTAATSPEVAATGTELSRRIDKHPVTCTDRSGFIVNALLFPYLNDAVRMLSEHCAGVDEIDQAMKNGCGYPMGPFELLDVVGLDVALAIQRALAAEFRECSYAPDPLLERLVAAGHLRRKTGRGFRTYT